jgi:hypothetical protein
MRLLLFTRCLLHSSLFACALLAPVPVRADAEGSGMLDFPDAADGRQVLAVDLHTHSVFSDGRVWPSLRVEEAERDGLSALAITEHLEWQPHAADLPHPDRNRPFDIASARGEKAGVTVINGAEITRGPNIGHMNAIFITDANRLLTGGRPSASTGKEMGDRYGGSDSALVAEALGALREARRQGAFVFLNHPSWVGQSPDGRGRLSGFHLQAIEENLIHGVEVGNGGHYSRDGFAMALAHDLAILGTSDVHGLVAWDYADADDTLIPGGRGARTVTLLLAEGETLADLRAALDARHTVALNDSELFGRRPELTALLGGALSFSIGRQAYSYAGESSVYAVTLYNAAPIPLVVRNRSGRVFADSTATLTLPPRGSVRVEVSGLPDPDEMETLEVEVLNAYTAPELPVKIALRRRQQ